MEENRDKKCDCWCLLEYCPIECNRKGVITIDDNRFKTDIHCFGPFNTPRSARQMNVVYEEIKTAPYKEDGSD